MMITLLLQLACSPSAPHAIVPGAAGEPMPMVAPAVVTPPLQPALPTRHHDTVEVIPRAAWGARAAHEGLKPHTITHLTVHHSATYAPDAASAAARIRGYQAYHQSKGFPDIAYHYVIDRAGDIYEGRSVDYAGSTFTNYDPAGHFLPLLDGNFETQYPSAEQVTGLVRLLAWASETYHVAPEEIKAHRDFAATLCPGKHLAELVESGEIARRVSEIIATSDMDLKLLDVDEGKRRIAALAQSKVGDVVSGTPAKAAALGVGGTAPIVNGATADLADKAAASAGDAGEGDASASAPSASGAR